MGYEQKNDKIVATDAKNHGSLRNHGQGYLEVTELHGDNAEEVGYYVHECHYDTVVVDEYVSSGELVVEKDENTAVDALVEDAAAVVVVVHSHSIHALVSLVAEGRNIFVPFGD